jgi:hypothetical protein
MIGVDFFIQDQNNPDRTRRARFPYDSINWLMQKLQDQGTFKRQQEQLPDSAIAMLGQERSLQMGTGEPVAQGSQAEIVPPSSATM